METSGASFTALGSNLCFCWNYLSRSLPPCCKLLPGFDEKHICAAIHRLSCFFPYFLSHPVLCFVHLVRRCAASPARSADLLSYCVWGLHAQPALFALVCPPCLRRLLADVSGTSEREGGSPCGSPGTMQTQGKWATASDTWESNTLQASGTIAAVGSDQVIPDCSCQ